MDFPCTPEEFFQAVYELFGDKAHIEWTDESTEHMSIKLDLVAVSPLDDSEWEARLEAFTTSQGGGRETEVGHAAELTYLGYQVFPLDQQPDGWH